MSTATLEQIEVIDSTQMRLLTEFEIPKENVVEGRMRFRIGQLGENVIIASVGGGIHSNDWLGTLFFERANLPRVIETIEKVLNGERDARGDDAHDFRYGKDHVVSCPGYITRIDFGVVISNHRPANLDGLELDIGFSMLVHPHTAQRLVEELKQLR